MCRGNLAREAYVYQGTYKGGIFEEGRISDILFQYILPNVCCATSDIVNTQIHTARGLYGEIISGAASQTLKNNGRVC